MRSQFLLGLAALLTLSGPGFGQLFSSHKFTPTIVFDLEGSEPQVFLVTRNGAGQRVSLQIFDSQVRLIPGSSFLVGATPGAKIRVTRNRPDPALPNGSEGAERGMVQSEAVALTLEETKRSLPNGTTYQIVTDKSLVVLPDGSVYIEATLKVKVEGKDEERKASTNILAAERWSFVDAFEPYMAISRKQPFEFAALTRFKTFGFNNNLRLDTVAVFTPGSDETTDDDFLGVGLSYSTFVGSQYKASGKAFFGFPARFTFTVGLKGLSFEKHTKGQGDPFFGIGIQIPIGG